VFIREAAKQHGIGIRELVVDDDHVHAEVDVSPTMSVSDAFGKLKGLSAFLLFKAFPNFRKRYHKGHFWEQEKSSGELDVQQEVVENYIRQYRSYR